MSDRLAQQVLHALYELLRGVQAADDASHGALLREPLAERPDDVYHALLTAILRLVFLLYAEERDLLPEGCPGNGLLPARPLVQRRVEDAEVAAAVFPAIVCTR